MGFCAVAAGLLSRLIGKGDKRPGSVKMLTQDGILVEVDLNHVPEKRMKATKGQVASWIWKNQKI